MGTLSIVHRCMMVHGPDAHEIILNNHKFDGFTTAFNSEYMKDCLSSAPTRINPAASEAYNMIVDVLIERGDIPPPASRIGYVFMHHVPSDNYLRWLGSAATVPKSCTFQVGYGFKRNNRGLVVPNNTTFSTTNAYPAITSNTVPALDFNLFNHQLNIVTRVPIDIPNVPGDVRFTSSTSSILDAMRIMADRKGYSYLFRNDNYLSSKEMESLSDIPWHPDYGLNTHRVGSGRIGLMFGKIAAKEKSFRTRETNTIKLMRNSRIKVGDIVLDSRRKGDHRIYRFDGWRFEYSPNSCAIAHITCLNPLDTSFVHRTGSFWFNKLGELKTFIELNGGEA